MRHRATVKLTYTANGTPYKWRFDCTCGAGGLSWSWSREYDLMTSGLDSAQWVVENGEPVGGALHMALDHLGIDHGPKLEWIPGLTSLPACG